MKNIDGGGIFAPPMNNVNCKVCYIKCVLIFTFQDLSQKLDDDKSLVEHLKLPIQRINDYKLLFKVSSLCFFVEYHAPPPTWSHGAARYLSCAVHNIMLNTRTAKA